MMDKIETPWFEVVQGDCQEVMAGMADNSVDAIVTDPPYGLKFMGLDWEHSVPGVPYWEAALRVLKPGGHLLAFGGARTYHRLTCAVEDAGFEVRDCLMWLYGSGFPKSKALLKPAYEPIVMGRKPGAKGVRLNIDACRIGMSKRVPGGRPSSSRNLYRDGWSNEHDSHGGRNPHLGRWPANVIHDGSDDVVNLFPMSCSGGGRKGEEGKRNYLKKAKSGSLCGARGGLGVGGKLYYDADRDDHYTLTVARDDNGSASRFFYSAKASQADRDEGVAGVAGVAGVGALRAGVGALRDGGRESRPRLNHHPTVKPTNLMRYLCRLITPPGGVILDPFGGSGSTGKGALLEGFNVILVEREAEYVEIARARCEHALASNL